MKKSLIITSILLMIMAMAMSAAAGEKITGKYISYKAGETTMKGLTYSDKMTGKRPGILVVHEWWGQNDYIRERARMLAAMGYVALAVDMYGNGKVASHPADAQAFSEEMGKDFETMKLRFNAAEDLLKKQKMVDPDKIAAIGYCMGGGVVLNMALQGADLKGVASFHGSLGSVKEIMPGLVKTRIIVFNGKDDKFITTEQIDAFKKKMAGAGVDYQFISYPKAMHSFTNPQADMYAKKFKLPLAYNAEADKKSWTRMKSFLQDIFE